MTIKYPREWADTYGFLNDRVSVSTAIEFVNSVQSAEFGSLIEMHNQHVEHGTNPDEDPVIETEREIQENLDSVTEWLRELEKNGQQTISTRKVKSRITDETGFELTFT